MTDASEEKFLIVPNNIYAVIRVSTTYFEDQWSVVGITDCVVSKDQWPDEAHMGVGGKSYQGGFVKAFINAFYGLQPWNCYYKDELFDEILYKRTRPENIAWDESKSPKPNK